MHDLTVSVVIPLYNKEEYVARAIDSILVQSVQDFEVVVVDDGSTDKGADIVKAMTDSRIRLFRQVNAGVSAARNKGINEARAELIAFLDADDAWRPQFLETALRLRKKYPQAGAYATAYEVKRIGGEIFVPKYKAIPLAPWEGVIPNYFKSALDSPPVWSSAVMIPKEIFKVCGYFPVGEKRAEDLDMWARIAFRYPVAFSRYVGAVYYQDAMNRACSSSNMVAERVVVKTIRKILELNQPFHGSKFYLREYMYFRMLESAWACARSGDIRAAKDILKSCYTQIFILKKMAYWFFIVIPNVFQREIVSFLDRRLKKKELTCSIKK